VELRRRSVRWGGGALDAVSAPGESVWGALYELPDGALDSLDAKEGEGLAYRRRTATVDIGGEPGEAVLYEVIEPEPDELPPTPEYAAMLLDAAAERGLPDDYVHRLRDRLGVSVPRP
jgi:hypothetical protein